MMRQLQEVHPGSGAVTSDQAVRRYSERYFVAEVFNNLHGALQDAVGHKTMAFKEALASVPIRHFTAETLARELDGVFQHEELRPALRRSYAIGAIGIRRGSRGNEHGRYMFHAVLTYLRPDPYLSTEVQPLVLALVVAVGGFVALVGAMMRAAAHGHDGEALRRYDLDGKLLAVTASVIASLGATGALPFEVGLVAIVLEMLALLVLCIVLVRVVPDPGRGEAVPAELD